LTEKKQVKITGTQSDVQTAFAVGDHLGIMANGFFKSYNGDNNYQHRGGLLELGAGYYNAYNSHVVFEAYGGGGMGRVYKQEMMNSGNNSQFLGSFTGNGSRIFLQPSIGFTSSFFDVALANRLSFVKYHRFSSTNYSTEELVKNDLDNVTDPLYVFVEPAVTARVGYKFIKVQAQYGLTINMGQNLPHTQNFATLGVIIDLKPKKKD
jgi:hypothetical protein